MTDTVDFRDNVSSVIGRLKWVEDMAQSELSPAEINEIGEIAETAYVVIRLLIKCGLQPHDLWTGDKADAIWIKPHGHWPET